MHRVPAGGVAADLLAWGSRRQAVRTLAQQRRTHIPLYGSLCAPQQTKCHRHDQRQALVRQQQQQQAVSPPNLTCRGGKHRPLDDQHIAHGWLRGSTDRWMINRMIKPCPSQSLAPHTHRGRVALHGRALQMAGRKADLPQHCGDKLRHVLPAAVHAHSSNAWEAGLQHRLCAPAPPPGPLPRTAAGPTPMLLGTV